VPHHEDVLESRGIAPCIPNLGTWLGVWSVSCPCHFTHREWDHGTHLVLKINYGQLNLHLTIVK